MFAPKTNMQKLRKLQFTDQVQEGQNPNGFTAQTKNGTAHCYGTGWNKVWSYEMPQLPEGGPWQTPNSNRTGE
jgi:hypothetical protein